MSNTTLSNSIIAKEALAVLENEFVLAKLVHRGYEQEFGKDVNGYTPGASITVRKPPRYTLREGATMSVQDSTEGTTTINADYQIGVDLGGWTSADRTLKIGDFSKRFLQPALKTVAQGVDAKIASLYKDVWNWVGSGTTAPNVQTAGNPIDSFADFSRGPQRLDEMSVPQGDRSAILSPADHWAMLGAMSGVYVQDTAKTAIQKAKLPMLGGIDTYMTQNTPNHTTGSRTDSSPVVNGNTTSAYADVKDTGTQSLAYTGAGSTVTFKQGDVFTIADVYAVNPVSKVAQTYLQQFVVKADVTSVGGAGTLTISPPIITSGAYQTVSTAGSINGKAIVNAGTASTGYRQNMAFHRNAFALVVVPMVKPEGAIDVQRASANGISVRMIPVYTGSSDTSAWRLDVLMGAKAIYPDLATRING